MRHRLVLLAVTAWTVLAVSGCSSDDDGARQAAAETTATVAATTTATARTTSTGAVAAPTAAAAAGRLEAVLRENAALTNAQGMSVAARLPNGRMVTATHGQAIVAPPTPVRADTAFGIGSVTKMLMATLLLRLAEERVVSLDDPLRRWVPGFRHPHPVTLRHLLSHTSGIPDIDFDRMQDDFDSHPHRKWQASDWRRWLPDTRERPDPRHAVYSNTNYLLLGEVVRAATGRPVADSLERLVLAPAGVAGRIFLQPDRRPAGRVAHGYVGTFGEAATVRDLSDGGPYVANTRAATIAGTAGAAVAAPATLVRWWDAVLQGRVLTAASLKQMTTYRPFRDAGDVAYGLGVTRFPTPAGDAVGHTGDIDGFQALLLHLPDADVTMALSINVGGVDDQLFARNLAGELIEALTGTPA